MAGHQSGFVLEPEFSIGSVLSRTFFTLFRSPLLFLGLAVVASVFTVLLDEMVPASFTGLAASISISRFLGMVVQGLAAYAVFLILTDEEISLGDILGHGLTRFFPLLLVSLLTGVCLLMGFILLIIPGLILMCVLAVTAQACVVEQLGAIDSMNRSVELTKGYRWHIFALYVIVLVGTWALFFIAGLVSALISPGGLPISDPAATFLGNLFIMAFDAVMAGIIYYDLRAMKEGVTLDQLADVFD